MITTKIRRRGKMCYKISKYEAIKAVLQAEEQENIILAHKRMNVIRRAVRDEIKKNIYSTVYCITENEKRAFENSACVILPFDE
jgi:hypothetical protein